MVDYIDPALRFKIITKEKTNPESLKPEGKNTYTEAQKNLQNEAKVISTTGQGRSQPQGNGISVKKVEDNSVKPTIDLQTITIAGNQEEEIKKAQNSIKQAQQNLQQEKSNTNKLLQDLYSRDKNFRSQIKIGNNIYVGKRDELIDKIKQHKQDLKSYESDIQNGIGQLESAKANLTQLKKGIIVYPTRTIKQYYTNPTKLGNSILQIDTGLANASSFDKFVNNLYKSDNTRPLGAFIQGIFKTSVAPPTEKASSIGEIAKQTIDGLKTNWKYATPAERVAFLAREAVEWVVWGKAFELAGKTIKEALREVPKFIGPTITIAEKQGKIIKSITEGSLKALTGRFLPKSKKLEIAIKFLGKAESELINKELKLTRTSSKVAGIIIKPVRKTVRIARKGLKPVIDRTITYDVRGFKANGDLLSKAVSKRLTNFIGSAESIGEKELLNLISGVSIKTGKIKSSIAKKILERLGVKGKVVKAITGRTFTQVDDLARIVTKEYSGLPSKLKKIVRESKLYLKGEGLARKIPRITKKPLARIGTEDLIILIKQSKVGNKVLKGLSKGEKTITKNQLQTLAQALREIQVEEKKVSEVVVKATAKRLQTALQSSKVLQRTGLSKLDTSKSVIKVKPFQNRKVSNKIKDIINVTPINIKSTFPQVKSNQFNSIRGLQNINQGTNQKSKQKNREQDKEKINDLVNVIPIERSRELEKVREITVSKPRTQERNPIIPNIPIPVIPIGTGGLPPLKIRIGKTPKKKKIRKVAKVRKVKEKKLLTRSLSSAYKKKLKPINVKPYYTGIEVR